MGRAPTIGDVYQVYTSVVPNGSNINRIVTKNSVGKKFTVIIEGSNVTLNHGATLYTPSQSTNKIMYGATLECFSYNSAITRVLNISSNTTILPVLSTPSSSSSSGIQGQRIYSNGYIYEYFSGTGWVKYAASTF